LDVTSGAADEIVGDRVSISNGTAVTGALGKNKQGMAFVFADVD
jgi:hypothetical protein